jgi:Ca2+-binding EF-hand superfamily protein
MNVSLRWLVMIVLVVGVLATEVGQAQTTLPPEWKERFRAHDQNGDARIDRAEFQGWMVDSFFLRDRGRKGYLTMDDVRGAMTPEVFRALSRAADGKLWLPEFLNALFLDFQAIDTDRVGSVTVEQIEAYVRRSPP